MSAPRLRSGRTAPQTSGAAVPPCGRPLHHPSGGPPPRSGEDLRDLLEYLEDFDEEGLARFLKGLPTPVQRGVFEAWGWQAHGGQREPDGDWRVWLMMAGRGFGKTRAGAEWVWARARECPEARIALVGPTLDDVAKVMVEGASGLLAVARTDEEAVWLSTKGTFTFPSGARAFAYSGEKPSRLRGPQHHFAWCDEIAQWARPEATWDNLMLGLRMGAAPRTVVTTTPRPVPVLKRIKALTRSQETGGRTGENAHLSEDYLEAVREAYEGTRLGRQELDGELIEDVEGALWSRALIEASRAPLDFARDERRLVRIVIGVDPPASVEGTCGIVACGVDGEGILYVLGDHSVGGASPEGWARKVSAAVEAWGAHRVVAEVNNGGRMVESVLRAVEPGLPLRLVHASDGKAARAEPVAAVFERGKARFAGAFPELEDELAGLTLRGGYQGPGRSPDRADAMVWAMTELMKPKRAAPSVRVL